MAEQITEAQLEAAAEAAHYAQGFDDYGVANEHERAEAMSVALAVLEAAGNVAPQARQCEVIHPYRGLRCSEPAEPRHAHVCDQPVQPSSTVDEGKLAEVLNQADVKYSTAVHIADACSGPQPGPWFPFIAAEAADRRAEWLRSDAQDMVANARILDALGFIDKTADNISTIRSRWGVHEVEELLAEIRTMLAPPPADDHPAHCRGCPDCQGIMNAGPLS